MANYFSIICLKQFYKEPVHDKV